MKHIVHMDDVHVSSYANLVLLNKLYAQIESSQWAIERKRFLRKQLREHKMLKCFYCNKGNLKLYTTKKANQATVDHYIPKSGGGDAFSSSNFVVCCHSCNRRKGSKTPEEFMNSDYIKNKRA